jgi:4-amino-4-deoxy-L-arabinose transferase-like glycosyltransferase
MKAMLKRLSSRGASLIIVFLIALAGGGAASYTSANGPWGAQDAAMYVITARNMMRGIGFGYTLPAGQFSVWTVKPPFYSLILAILGRFGVDLVDAARWLNVLLFVGTIVLAGLIFIRFSSRPAFSIPASLLLAVFPTMVRMYSSSLSEPLFVFCLLASIFCLLGGLKSGSYRWLIPAALLTALLTMTRYIGVAMLPVGVVGIFLFLPGSWKERLKKIVLFGILSGLPILVWETWIYLFVDHSLAGRTVGLDRSVLSGNFIRFYSSITQLVLSWFPLGANIWDLRFRWRYVLIFLIVAIGIVVTLLAVHRSHKRLSLGLGDGDFQMFSVWGMWVICYLLFLAIDGVIATPNPPITNRILLPLFPGLALGLLAGLVCWQNAWFQGRWRWLQVLAWIIGIGGVFWYLPVTYNQVMIPLRNQTTMISYTWKKSETMAAVRALPKDVVIISNDSYIVRVWADRPAYDLMENMQVTFFNRDTPYGSDLSDPAQAAFHGKNTVLVIFTNEFSQQLQDMYGDSGPGRMRTLLTGLLLVGEYADGAIYRYP